MALAIPCTLGFWDKRHHSTASRVTPFTESRAQRSGIGLVNRPSVQR